MFTKAALAVAMFASGATALAQGDYEFLFSKWVQQHNKKYETTEFMERFRIFKSNLDFVTEQNQKNLTYTLEMNHFGDLSWDEFRTTYLGYNHVKQPFLRSLNEQEMEVDGPLADIDWRTKGAVTPVKNQGQCGSCWAFSSTGSLEAQHQKATGSLVSFSEQQLVDCAHSFGNNGCRGGLMDHAFEYWKQNAACKEADYAYTARDGTCKNTCTGVTKTSGYKDVPSGQENALDGFLANGPVSIAIEADQSSFQFYKGGVFQGPCGRNLDHGVLLVGSGGGANGYWIVKNSWGAGWGEQGYIRFQRGKNMCGIAQAASQPMV